MIWQKKQNKTKTLKQIENQQKGSIFYSSKIDILNSHTHTQNNNKNKNKRVKNLTTTK